VVGFWQARGVADQQRPVDLLDDGTLAGCAVVANCEMNRQRQLTGVNSYTRELGFDPIDMLTAALTAASVEGRAGPGQDGTTAGLRAGAGVDTYPVIRPDHQRARDALPR
jgi:hypothetical protein